MRTKRLACRTCGTMQDFRLLNDAEKAAVRKDKGIPFVHDYWRCTASGCLWYHRWYKKSDGGTLPEEFREPKPETATG
ncbi:MULTISPECIES: hypothetical protein [unclassified Streptomyces]|uniref:hypothetical protein n=1 Tax=unclassified Streptomyces TaxID=2593676 RepID=UPI002E146117|nr:hypothetical protein OG324_16985 [Streptomyces sp. NBC_01236]